MRVEQLFFSHIQDFFDYALARNDASRKLSEVQVAVLYASWEKLSYEQMANQTAYDNGSLGNAASVLFKDLSRIFEQKITKNTLHRFIEAQLEDPSCYLHQLTVGIFGSPYKKNYFVGREKELFLLENLILENQCIFVVGSPGIGKTSLVGRLYEKNIAISPYDSLVWYHAICKKPEEDVSNLLFDVFKEKDKDTFKDFLGFIKNNRSLVVLDGIEEWFLEDKNKAENFLRKLIDSNHQSKLIFTCHYLPISICKLQSNRSMGVFELEGLVQKDCKEILHDYGLEGDYIQRLIQSFQGNPSYLHHGCKRIKELFGGNIDFYLQSVTSFAADLMKDDIAKIDIGLSDTEKHLLKSIVKESLEGKVLLEKIIQNIQHSSNISFSQILTGIEMLAKKSLVKVNSKLDKSEIEVPRLVRKYYFQAL